jgi:uncharacterized protein (TIGR00251 family)
MSFIVDIKVVPNSGKQKFVLDKSGILKCFIKSAPEKGLANNEFIKFLSKSLGLTQNDVEIVSGLTERKKRVRINKDLSFEQLLNLLAIDKQESIKFK